MTHSALRFPPGQVIMTAGVDALIRQGVLAPFRYLLRHLGGDWGELSDHDRQCNEQALHDGNRLLSAYRITASVKLWIITEADRSVTTLLLPHEY